MTDGQQADALNPARASRFAVVRHWRGVSDPFRSASFDAASQLARMLDLL